MLNSDSVGKCSDETGGAKEKVNSLFCRIKKISLEIYLTLIRLHKLQKHTTITAECHFRLCSCSLSSVGFLHQEGSTAHSSLSSDSSSCPLPPYRVHLWFRQTWGLRFDIWHEWSPPTDSIWTQRDVWVGDRRTAEKHEDSPWTHEHSVALVT